MLGKSFVCCFFLGLAVAGLAESRKFDRNKLNITAFQKPHISSTSGITQFWDPDFCNDWEDMDAFPHPDSCQEFLICWQGELWEMICEDGDLFDPWDAVCDSADQVTCLDDWPPEGNWPEDDECPPPGSNEIRFLPSLYCDEFYICINGQPVLLQCRPGQHWNIEEEFCDDPSSARCDPDAELNPDHPNQLPDCPIGFVGQLPHPGNCNWFIHCNNGNRSIQQCQHLHHFDVDQGRCVVKTISRCIKQARFRN